MAEEQVAETKPKVEGNAFQLIVKDQSGGEVRPGRRCARAGAALPLAPDSCLARRCTSRSSRTPSLVRPAATAAWLAHSSH